MSGLVLLMAELVSILIDVYMVILLIAVVVSWVRPDPYHPLVRFLYRITEPVLRPVRRLIGSGLGPIDLSPAVVMLALMLTRRFLVSFLVDLSIKIN